MIAPTLDCGGGGDCPEGEECLPSDYVPPCAEGEECLPDNYIDPADCPGGGCAEGGGYQPYCITPSGDDLDTVILDALPVAYYKMDDASGLMQDSSAGGTSDIIAVAGSLTYHEPALSTASAFSIRFNGAVAVVPALTPNNNPGGANPWSGMMLAMFNDFDTGASGNGVPAILSFTPAGGSPPAFIWSQINGRMILMCDSSFGNSFGTQGFSPPEWTLELNKVYAIGVVCEANDVYVYVDGVLVATTRRAGSGFAGDTFTIGRSADTWWSSADWWVSNVALYNYALAYSQVRDIHQAMMDAAVVSDALIIAA